MPHRQWGRGARTNGSANRKRNANRRRFCPTRATHHSDRRNSGLGVHRGQLEHSCQRNARSLRGSIGRPRREHFGAEAKIRYFEISRDATSLPFRSEPSHSVCVPTEAYVVAQSERGGIWNHRSGRCARRGNFPSLSAFKGRLLEFIEYFNRTFAKPFRWTYTGRLLTAKTAKRPATWRESWVRRREISKNSVLAG